MLEQEETVRQLLVCFRCLKRNFQSQQLSVQIPSIIFFSAVWRATASSRSSVFQFARERIAKNSRKR